MPVAHVDNYTDICNAFFQSKAAINQATGSASNSTLDQEWADWGMGDWFAG